MDSFERHMDDVIYLVRCAIRSEVADADRVARMDLDQVYQLAEKHLVVALCAAALESVGACDNRFVQARAKALRKVIIMDAEREELFRRLDEAGIWYVPLKGCMMQHLYPEYGLRQMSDNDILFDASRADDVRHIMEAQGFTTHHVEVGAHDVYFKEPVCNFEMHRLLFGSAHEQTMYRYFLDVTRFLIPNEDGTCGCHFSDEDFYVYLIAHEYGHYRGGGTGLRSLLDTYVYLQAKTNVLDWDYMARELAAAGLTEFEQRNRQLSLHLFSGEELAPEDEELLSYIESSGAYGTFTHRVQNQIGEHGRLGFLIWKAFPPYSRMAHYFPVLRRAPVLLPACWVWRLAKGALTRTDRMVYQVKKALRRDS